MKPPEARTNGAPLRVARHPSGDHDWPGRAARLYTEFERPARAMVRRAFRSAFDEHELDDIYSGAWLGILRALAPRHEGMSDEEIRSYVFTAVANQASREIRRRKRKPIAPLEDVQHAAPDPALSPEEQATAAERTRITRDLLVSLPPRRRAVMLLRYGWGLEPRQVCSLVDGLSARAYRKEVTRGVDELAEKMRTLERGEWCADREPVLKAYAAGLGDAETERQAQAHLSHCRECSDFVAKLSGHLHDLASGIAGPLAVDGIDGRLGVIDRVAELGDRARETLAGFAGRPGAGVEEAASAAASTGVGRGAGAAGAGVIAKLTALGTAGKTALACLGGGAAATACIAAGVAPLPLAGADKEPDRAAVAEAPAEPGGQATPAEIPAPEILPGQIGNHPAPAPEQGESGGGEAPEAEAPAPEPEPVAPTAPPTQQQFGVAAGAAPASAPSPARSTVSDAGGGSGDAGASAVQQEFGP